MKSKTAHIICAVVTMSLIALAAFSMGVHLGIRHAIEDSKLYAEGSSVFIDLDGQVYEHHIN